MVKLKQTLESFLIIDWIGLDFFWKKKKISTYLFQKKKREKEKEKERKEKECHR